MFGLELILAPLLHAVALQEPADQPFQPPFDPSAATEQDSTDASLVPS